MRKRMKNKRVAGVAGLATLALAGVFAGVFLPAGAAGTNVCRRDDEDHRQGVRVQVRLLEEERPHGDGRSSPSSTRARSRTTSRSAARRRKTLLPGKSAKLTVKFAKKGQYAFLCTLFGHAKAGMKGKFAVAVKPVATTTQKTTTTTTTTTPPPTGPVGNANTTVNVGHVRVRLQPLAAVGPVGPGHVRDHEQRQRGAQLHRPGREGRHPAQSRASRRRTRSACRRSVSATSATCRSTSIAACWGP